MLLGRTVGELERTMSMNELREWAAFAESEPIGDLRADFRSAIVALTIAQVNGNKGKKVSDFMPFMRNLDDDRAEAASVTQRFHAEFAKATRGRTLRVIR